MVFTVVLMILCVAADQFTKYLAVERLSLIDTYPVLENILHFTYVENRGAAFGMLANHRWIFMILSTVAILALLAWLFIERPKSWWFRVAIAFIIAGGIGNMIDRIRLGYVVDFIDCRFIDFYVFNVADSCVCVGCAMFIIGVLYMEIKEKKKKAQSAAGGDENGSEKS